MRNLMQQRDTYFDFLRGIAIIMVIGIHTYTRWTDALQPVLATDLELRSADIFGNIRLLYRS